MRYQRSYLFFFQSPHWAINLLAGSGCVLVPLVGWALFAGYLLEQIETRLKRSDKDYPAFDLERVGDYLARGMRPVLVQLLVMLPLLVGVALALWAGMTAGKPPAKGPSMLAKTLAACLPPIAFSLALLFSLFLAPLTLHLGVRDPSIKTGVWRFSQDFLKHVWRETLLAELFVWVTGLSLVVVGLVPCGFAAPSALALVCFAQYHLLGQLYELYRERVGTSMPLAEAVPTNV
jgi:hypothetical protein